MKDSEKIKVILVQPMKTAKVIEIEETLGAMQSVVEGSIEEYMPFEDDVAIICNDEGKIKGLDLNRAIYDEEGKIQEIICGTFFLCYAPIDSEKFLSMPYDLLKKYEEKFRYPEQFFKTEDGIKAVRVRLKNENLER
ncbi:DUF3846 domain-containing protein [Anaerofustis stercorihominis]|uniref:DUF3846 domain-containing protein n=1 Tax=Anaerofustis stercorihominis TaxID=214853 RepID=UPI002109A27E|nr:DUF3846 domain-containing protein [Anaerofustis stercorihominis]MCQ4794149.1 DUF3846 domain-containing protein [Anaerofustis stercorihominis]